MITCWEALDSYYREHLMKKAVDRKRAEDCIFRLREFFGDKRLRDIDIPLCRKYCEQREVSDSTRRRELGVLRAAAGHALKWRRITAADMPSIELPPESENRKVWLYKDELARFLDVAERMDSDVFRFTQLAYHTASRRAAIERLEWSQVDEVGRRINLAKPGERKTKKRRPIVPISDSIASELAVMRAEAKNQWVLGSPKDLYESFAWTAREAGLIMLPVRGVREAGRLSPHALRHSRATHLLEDGKSPWAVASLLGDTVTTVLRVYGHACPDYLSEVLS